MSEDRCFHTYLHSTLVEERIDPFCKRLFLYRKPLILQSPYSAFFKIMIIVLLVKEVWVPTIHSEQSNENTSARDKLSTNSLCLDFDLLLFLLMKLGRSGSAGAGRAHFTGNNSDSPTGVVSHNWSFQQRFFPKAQSFKIQKPWQWVELTMFTFKPGGICVFFPPSICRRGL